MTASEMMFPGSNLLMSAACVVGCKYSQLPTNAATATVIIEKSIRRVVYFFAIFIRFYSETLSIIVPVRSPLVMVMEMLQVPLPSSDVGTSNPSHDDDDGF